MVSAVENMAANSSWSAFGKATDLRHRILFTLGLLIVYRLGTFIPVPGIDGAALREFMESAGQGIGGMVSMFTGGALGRMGIFALGIMPYISASIIVQLLTSMVPSLEQLKKEGEQGRKKINQYTRWGTVALATVQSYGLAVSLEAGDIAADPGMYFRIACMITLLGGTMFLMWLGEQITARKIHIQYPRRQVGMKVYDGGSSHLPVKVNPAGVIPAIFASSLLLLPVTISTFSGNSTSPVMSWLLANFGPGQPLYLLFFVAMIVFFAYFYTFNVSFKPDDVADNLKNQNGFVPGIRPGKRTAEYLEYVVNRVLVLGSAYLAAVCILPEILRGQFAIPFYFGGTSVLIVVSVTMDTIQQVQSHLLAHQYEGLLEKSQLRGKSGKGRKKRSPARK